MAYLPLAIHLVSQTPALHRIWFHDPVVPTHLGPSGTRMTVAIVDQRGRSLRRTRAQVDSHEGLGLHRAAPGHKLVRTELVRLRRIPCPVEDGRAFLFGTDSI